MKWRTITNITKTLLEVPPAKFKVPSLGVFDFKKKIITELLLVLPLYLVFFFHLVSILTFNKNNG